jgi:uncharacterized protein
MKLHLAGRAGLTVFTSCGADFVEVNGQRHTTGLIALPERLISPWAAPAAGRIGAEDLAILASLCCEIVLIGTGPRQVFLPPQALRPLIEAGVGVEMMSTPAACRTFNILAAEDRKVAAAILPGS